MSITTTPYSRLTNALGAGTVLRWTGVPAQGILFRQKDAMMIPFSLLWCGFAIFWESMALLEGTPLVFRLFGIPFVVVGLYLVFGRFAVDCYARAHTSYAVGEDTIYIVRDGMFPRTITITQSALSPIEMQRRPDGSGTLFFGAARPDSTDYGQLASGTLRLGFERIPDVDTVYRLVEDIARKK